VRTRDAAGSACDSAIDFDRSSAKPVAGGDIDVVIPVYNGAPYIRDCVASVLSQTLQPRHVIIVDDGSTDDTAEVVHALLRCHPILKFHRMDRNSGVSAARNAGIRLSDAPFIAFIDADDIWMPNKLALQRQIFAKSQQPVGFVHSSFFLIDEDGSTIPHERGLPPLLCGDIFSRLLRERNILSGSASSVLIKRDILDKAGVFDDQLYYGEDWDLWLRLAAISEVDHTPEALVGIRVRRSAIQHGNRNGIDRFLQVVKVYSHWERQIRDEGTIVTELREDGFRAALTGARNFQELACFYGTLKTSNESLARSLYSDQFHFWSGLMAAAVRGASARLSRSIVGGRWIR
jgi:glycosyltransferase involved in cell wall biosynthesis